MRITILVLFSLSCLSINLLACKEDHDIQICSRIHEIRVIPFKGEPIDDYVYNKLIKIGKRIIPCLIEKVSDTTIMQDPRKAPPYFGTTVGDVSLFVLLNIENIDLEYILPEKIKDAYRNQGVYAYFHFVEDPHNREIIKRRLKELLMNGNNQL